MTNQNPEYYFLSNEADSDLDEIFDYTLEEHGFNQAVKYLSDLEILFEKIVQNPNLGRKRGELKKIIFSISEQEHTVFYQRKRNHILIVRVMHGRKDIQKWL